MKCLFCNKLIKNRRINLQTKYCSISCNKHSWYLKKNPSCKSYFSKNSLFWKTETGIGLKWEMFASKILKAKHLKFNYNGADLIWNNKLIDVKSAHLYKRKFKRGKPVKGKQFGIWVFHRGKEKKIDFFFCICLLNNKPHKTLLIPNDKFPKNGLSIGKKSVYDRYEFP